jgi:hypothetical protein
MSRTGKNGSRRSERRPDPSVFRGQDRRWLSSEAGSGFLAESFVDYVTRIDLGCVDVGAIVPPANNRQPRHRIDVHRHRLPKVRVEVYEASVPHLDKVHRRNELEATLQGVREWRPLIATIGAMERKYRCHPENINGPGFNAASTFADCSYSHSALSGPHVTRQVGKRGACPGIPARQCLR